MSLLREGASTVLVVWTRVRVSGEKQRAGRAPVPGTMAVPFPSSYSPP